jgi:NAD(P)-dependent dehydrogenase (short-subunit alcohol dehydrogenase family)
MFDSDRQYGRIRFCFDAAIDQVQTAVSVPAFYTLKTLRLVEVKSIPHVDLSGKIAIVTGCNKGVGKRTALHLAEMGATVIMAVRSETRGIIARAQIVEELALKGKTDLKLEVQVLDLTDTKSIRKFARYFTKNYSRLDILVNNAGTCVPGKICRNISIVFTVSFLGHFLLVELLYEILKNTPHCRVVNLSSVMHKYGSTNWEYYLGEKKDRKLIGKNIREQIDAFLGDYCDSKLANLLHAEQIRKRFEADGVTGTAFAVNPGSCRTEIYKVLGVIHPIVDIYMKYAFLTPDQGCYTSVITATAPLEDLKEKDGTLPLYFQPYALFLLKNPILGQFIGCSQGVPIIPENDGKRLMEVSCQLIQLLESADNKNVSVISPKTPIKVTEVMKAPGF